MTVYLVGAGPGDPGLLTVRGRDLLSSADVVLFDGLVDPRVLEYAPSSCLLVDVGKTSHQLGQGGSDRATQPGEHAQGRRPGAPRALDTRQEVTNAQLVEYGRRYACVVRLKGGDPFVFGRGGEEALVLARAGVPFEIVPGVSSAVAVPAYAGIPVTHRGLAASVAIVTGHEAPGKTAGEAGVDWARLATAVDTLVILMAVGHLTQIAADLIAHGRDPHTPAAVIEQGTTGSQRRVTGLLRDLPALAAAASIRSPAVVVVGSVVGLAAHLAWFHSEGAPESATTAVQGVLRELVACA